MDSVTENFRAKLVFQDAVKLLGVPSSIFVVDDSTVDLPAGGELRFRYLNVDSPITIQFATGTVYESTDHGTVTELVEYYSTYTTPNSTSISLVGLDSSNIIYGNAYDFNPVTGDASRLIDMKFKTQGPGFIFTTGGPGVHESFSIEIKDQAILVVHTTEPTVADEIFVQTIEFSSPYYEFYIKNNGGDYIKVVPQLLVGKSYTFKTYPGHLFDTHPFRLTVDSVNYDLDDNGNAEFTVTIPAVDSLTYVCINHSSMTSTISTQVL